MGVSSNGVLDEDSVAWMRTSGPPSFRPTKFKFLVSSSNFDVSYLYNKECGGKMLTLKLVC